MVTLFLPQEMLIRVFLGWLRGEPLHCKMVAIPTLEEEDARRPSRAWHSGCQATGADAPGFVVRPARVRYIGDIEPAGRCDVGRWSAHSCDARILKEGAAMWGAVGTGFLC